MTQAVGATKPSRFAHLSSVLRGKPNKPAAEKDEKEKDEEEAKKAEDEEDEAKDEKEDDEAKDDEDEKSAKDDEDSDEDEAEEDEDEDKKDAKVRKQARAFERGRIRSILTCAGAKAHPEAALAFALDTNMPASHAMVVLGNMGSAAADTPARDDLRTRMSDVKNPSVGADGGQSGQPNLADQIVAAGKKRRGEA